MAEIPARWLGIDPRIDGRSAAARRTKALTRQWVDRLGGPAAVDALMLARIKRAAELTVIAAMCRAEMLSGSGKVLLDDLVRIENTSSLAVKRLHLDRKQEPEGLGALRDHNGSD